MYGWILHPAWFSSSHSSVVSPVLRGIDMFGCSNRNPSRRGIVAFPSDAFFSCIIATRTIPSCFRFVRPPNHDEHGHPTGFAGEAEVLPNRTRTDPSQDQRRSHHKRTHTCRADTRSRSGHGEIHAFQREPTETLRKQKKERDGRFFLSNHGIRKHACEGYDRPKPTTNVRGARRKGGTTFEPRRRSKQKTRTTEPTTHVSARKTSERNVTG